MSSLSLDDYQVRQMATVKDVMRRDSSSMGMMQYGLTKSQMDLGRLSDLMWKFRYYDEQMNHEEASRIVGELLWDVSLLAWSCGYGLNAVGKANLEAINTEITNRKKKSKK